MAKKLMGFCKKCRKKTEHKFKKSFIQVKKKNKYRGVYEYVDWFECTHCYNKVGEDETDETFMYM